jgi:Cdc6-like AAA superfamily ATPase
MNPLHSKSTLVRALRGCFGKFRHVVDIHNRMNELMQYSCQSEEPEYLVLLGETGVGKSTLLKRFLKDHPRIEHPEFTEIPVLYAEIPSRCTIKMLVSHLLSEMRSPFWNRGDELERTRQFVKLLKTTKVRLILLDEVNHLVDRGKEKSHYTVGDWVKQLGTRSGLPIVLTGIPRSKQLFETNEQLADRFGEIVYIEPMSAEEQDPHSIRSAMTVFKTVLGDLDTIDLTTSSALKCFAYASGGRLRGIRRILVRAVELAYANAKPKPKINMTTLSKAFKQVIYPKAPPTRDPFDKKFNGVPLTQAGEPYALKGSSK